VLCHHGARSLSVTMWLRREGFDHAQSLAGGIDEWSRKIDPTVPRY
jgi:rhodanese-related sulfurtransferase